MIRKLTAIFFLASLALVNAQNDAAPAVPSTNPSTEMAPQQICAPDSDRLLVADWNTSSVLKLCRDYTGRTNSITVAQTEPVRQIIPFDEYNFLLYSQSGLLQWQTPEQIQEWDGIRAGGRLANEPGRGFTLTDVWAGKKLHLTLWPNKYYQVDSMPLSLNDRCAFKAANSSGVEVCVDGRNRSILVSRQADFTGRRESQTVEFKQFPVGTVAIGQRMFVLLAAETTYSDKPCPGGICPPMEPISILPGKIVEIFYDYGQTAVRQKVLLDGMSVTPDSNLSRLAASPTALYWVSGGNIHRYDASSGKVNIFYIPGQSSIIGAIAVAPRY
jgi:hypothetical protein